MSRTKTKYTDIDPTLRIPVPRRVLLFGDSISNNNNTINASAWPNNIITHNAEGYFTWANGLLGHRLYLDPSLNKGVSGETSTQILARYAADVAANYASFDIAFVLAGSNDLSGATTTGQMDTALSNIQSIVTRMVAAGKWVVLFSVIPRAGIASDATGRKLHQYLNTKIRRWIRTQPDVIFIDAWRDLADPADTTGTPVSTLMAVDGTHPNPGGAYYMGKRVYDVLSPLIPPASDLLASAADVYDGTTNPYGNRLANPAFTTGTGGTATSPCTGTVVGSWTLAQLAGTFVATNCVGSVETQSAGYGAVPGKKQVVTVSITSKTSFESFQLVQGVTGFSAGDVVELFCELDVSNISHLLQLELRLGESDGASFPVSASDGYNNLYGGEVPSSLTYRTFHIPRYTVQANSRTLYCAFVCTLDATASASVTLKIGGVALRKVA